MRALFLRCPICGPGRPRSKDSLSNAPQGGRTDPRTEQTAPTGLHDADPTPDYSTGAENARARAELFATNQVHTNG